MNSPPDRIRGYEEIKPVDRGFYGAAYRARQPSLNRTVILKVCPVGLYDEFGKNWMEECQTHAELADTTRFLAGIMDQFDEELDFQGSSLRCHVAVLEYIEGRSLADVIYAEGEDVEPLPARTAAQIALDLYEILDVFRESQQFHHNDLHARNIIVRSLPEGARRSNALDPSIRAVGIDLNSVTDESLSDDNRLGDHHHISRHIAALASRVHQSNTGQRDEDYRITLALRGLAEHLTPEAEAQRAMTVSDAARALHNRVQAADRPWGTPLVLRRFSDTYNAQTLESWYVPDLWFDPNGRWLAKTTSRGPQVITGMRGCGKTMLLRALHFHARVAPASGQTGDEGGTLERIADDDFVGLFVSCQRLLNPQDRDVDAIERPFERLYVAYVRDAIQVLRHLRDLDDGALIAGIDTVLHEALRVLDLPDGAPREPGELAFDQFLFDLQIRLANGAAQCKLRVAPAEAFAHLANVVQKASSHFAEKYVLFLLDDASTRYLDEEMTRMLISQLLFQNPQCAFRISTEAQTLQRYILSPGQASPANPTRDYEEIDLGNDVYRLLKKGSLGDRMEFVTQVLQKRGEKFADPLYQRDPKEVLGDVPLSQIATEIAESSKTSAKRKHVYRGLRALQAVCVGDMGDVVKIYEKILEQTHGQELPVSARNQSESFLAHSGGLMWNLDRQSKSHKDLALAFAQASGELLHRSGRLLSRDEETRLRQYTQLYVRVDPAEDSAEVAGKLFDLLDAGVFVLSGGVPRTKTKDDDPVLQFKLSYRKILGLASFIGLSDRDRFELSGDALRRWLTHPAEAKDILVENQVSRSRTDQESIDEGEADAPPSRSEAPSCDDTGPGFEEPDGGNRGIRGEAEKRLEQQRLDIEPATQSSPKLPAPDLGIHVVQKEMEDLGRHEFDSVVIALGFEERAVESAKRVLEQVRTNRVILVEYDKDQGREVLEFIDNLGLEHTTVRTPDDLEELLMPDDEVLVDVSGMSKPFLFAAVRVVLSNSNRVFIVHTRATNYYPRNEDLKSHDIDVDQILDPTAIDRVGELLMGEEGPYDLVHVHHVEAAPDRWRALLASASAKNDRLLHLLENRSYDTTSILVPEADSPRARLARCAADLASSAADANVATIDVDTDDLQGAVDALETAYAELYFESGANVELGLTGSKMHAVASAALAAAARVSDAWYVSPAAFDQDRFTEGVGETNCFRVEIDPDGSGLEEE